MDYNSGTFGYSYGWSTAAPVAPPPPPQSHPMSVKTEQHSGYSTTSDVQKMAASHAANQQLLNTQKPVGYWMPPGNKSTSSASNYYGSNTASNTRGNGNGMGGGSFPKKSKTTNWPGAGGGDKKRTAVKKELETAGKTPAMLLHELYKTVTDRYEEISVENTASKRYRCTITIEGREFSEESNNKKNSKQLASEAAIRSLRPDIQLTPFEDSSKAPPTATTVKNEGGPPSKKPKISGSDDAIFSGNTSHRVSNKAKVAPIDAAVSLTDFMRRLCMEHPDFNPQMDHVDITESDLPPEKSHKRRFRFTLSFPEQGKEYKTEGYGKNAPKDVAIRDALKDLFKVDDADIRKVVTRSIVNKVENMGPIQVLYHLCALTGNEAAYEVKEAERKMETKDGVPVHPTHVTPQFVATLTVKDPNTQKEQKVIGEVARSKVDARELAAVLAVKEVFEMDLENLPRVQVPVSATQKLHVLLVKQAGRNKAPIVTYEELPSESEKGVSEIFRSKVTVGDKEFIGIGRSKKAAKNQASHVAIKGIFKYDFNEEVNNDPETRFHVSRLCVEISEYAKREYFNMCNYYMVKPSSDMAAFFLVNEKNEKRLISVGSAQQVIVDGRQVVNSEGQALVHIQSIILARRSMIRYFMAELEKLGQDACIFVKGEDGHVILKKELRVVLYSTFSPDITHSGLEATIPALTCYAGHGGCEPMPAKPESDEHVLSTAVSTGRLRVHSVADKIFKWAHLGVQGGLLSNIISPIVLHTVFFGSLGQFEDVSLKHSFYGRLGNTFSDVVVESNKVTIRPQSAVAHVWTRDLEHVESLNLDTGRTNKGSPSRLAKAEIFQHFLKLRPEMSSLSYAESKSKAVNYQTVKNMFYEKIAEKGQGQWQRKPVKMTNFYSASHI